MPIAVQAAPGGDVLATWDAEAADVVMARVDGAPVTMGNIRVVSPRYPGYLEPFDDRARRSLIQRAIDAELLFQEGIRTGLHREPEVVYSLRHLQDTPLEAAPAHLQSVLVHEDALTRYEGGCGQEDLILATVDGFYITGAYLDRWWRWLMVGSRRQLNVPGRPPRPEPAIVWPSHLGNTRQALDSLIGHIDRAEATLSPDGHRSPATTCAVARAMLAEAMGEPRPREDLTDEEVLQWYDRHPDRLEITGSGIQLWAFEGVGSPEDRNRACETRANGEELNCTSYHFDPESVSCQRAWDLMTRSQPIHVDASGRHRELRCAGPYPVRDLVVWEVPEAVAEHSSELGPELRSECIEGPNGSWYVYESYVPPLIAAPPFEGAIKRARHLAAIDWNRERLYEPLLESLRAAAVIEIDEDALQKLDFLPQQGCDAPMPCRLGIGW